MLLREPLPGPARAVVLAERALAEPHLQQGVGHARPARAYWLLRVANRSSARLSFGIEPAAGAGLVCDGAKPFGTAPPGSGRTSRSSLIRRCRIWISSSCCRAVATSRAITFCSSEISL